jgi:hypothetical protein
MIYKCYECGRTFEDGEECIITEMHNLDGPPYEVYKACPFCGQDYSEAIECAVCGEICTDEEGKGGICDECFDKYANDFEACYNFAIGTDCKVPINDAIAYAFDPSDINDILKKYIKEHNLDINWRKFAEENEDSFRESIAREVRK